VNIVRAIEILNAIVTAGEYQGDPDDSAAVKLGIEAFRRIEAGRIRGYDYLGHLLPGETEEEERQYE